PRAARAVLLADHPPARPGRPPPAAVPQPPADDPQELARRLAAARPPAHGRLRGPRARLRAPARAVAAARVLAGRTPRPPRLAQAPQRRRGARAVRSQAAMIQPMERIAREQWAPDGVYLNTASYGLPPKVGWDALQAALADWRGGRTSWEHWGESTERSREAWAAMVGVSAGDVAVGATVSGLVGLVAASLPAGARVVAPDVEFTSTLFPFLVAQEEGRATVRTVPPADLAEAVGAATDVVAFSAVQMSTGEVPDLDAIAAAAEAHRAITVVDATQACGWLPLDASRFDVVVAGAYKWLMSPRGT